MDLSTFRILIAIAEHGGFSQAAKMLHLSQSTVSTQIRQLEQRLDVRLLDRKGRAGASLTPAGEIAYQHAKEMLLRYAEMEASLEKLKHGTLGNCTVMASYTCYTYLLPRVLSEFRRSFPDVRLLSSTGSVPDVLEAVRRHQAHLGIAWGPVSGDFVTDHLLDEPFYITTRWDHPLAQQSKVTPEDIAPFPFVLDPPTTSMRGFVEETFRQAGIRLLHPIEFGTPAGSKEGILAGLGIGILASTAMAREVSDGLLSPLHVEGLHMVRPLLMVHRKDAELTPNAQTFRSFVIHYLKRAQIKLHEEAISNPPTAVPNAPA